MIVYLICETVDLGYHVVAGYQSEEKAKAELEKMIEQAKEEKIQALKKINYSQKEAENFVQYISFYELDSVEVE